MRHSIVRERAAQTVVVVDSETSQDQLRAQRGELAVLRDSRAALDSQIAL